MKTHNDTSGDTDNQPKIERQDARSGEHQGVSRILWHSMVLIIIAFGAALAIFYLL